VLKRLAVILPLLFALLSFKVSASILVLTGGYIQTESTEDVGKSIRHFTDCEQANIFEEYIEEGEEEDSETSSSVYFSFYQTDRSASNSSQGFVCRNVKRKLFLLYQSYKIDCCKF
jgi:hypothetical protein